MKKRLIYASGLLLIISTFVWGSGITIDRHSPEIGFTMTYAIWALILGGISAISLPLGSILGIVSRPKTQITAALAAFGAGALLAALSVELVAPTMLEMTHFSGTITGEGSPLIMPVALIFGCILGGIVFVLLDQLIIAHGGYLRKTATAITYMSHRKSELIKKLLQRLCQSEFFRNIPIKHVQLLVDQVHPAIFNSGDIIFKEGEPGDKMYFIEEGEIELTRSNEKMGILSAGDVLGEIAVVTGAHRTAQARAITNVKSLVITRQVFQQIRSLSPEFEEATLKLASDRLEKISAHDTKASQAATEWAVNAANALRLKREVPTPGELRSEAQKHPGAPLAIWLGILLDGIPESFVIGSNFLVILRDKMVSGTPSFGEMINYTLIAGLFLSNFPEAMSSSTMMRNQNLKFSKILVMWLSIMLMTALGSTVGYAIGADVSPVLVVAIEGLAAGSMLTMIAQTMIPEAVHLGGTSIVGLSTLFGFLSAVAFKLLQA